MHTNNSRLRSTGPQKLGLKKARGDSRTTFINFIVIAMFFILITSFIIYFQDTEPHVQAAALSNNADKMAPPWLLVPIGCGEPKVLPTA